LKPVENEGGWPTACLNYCAFELSGGEQQMVSIARALANRPAIILAEPTGEVDTKTRDLVIDILRRLSDAGQTVIIVTHDPWVAERTDRVITLVDGRGVS